MVPHFPGVIIQRLRKDSAGSSSQERPRPTRSWVSSEWMQILMLQVGTQQNSPLHDVVSSRLTACSHTLAVCSLFPQSSHLYMRSQQFPLILGILIMLITNQPCSDCDFNRSSHQTHPSGWLLGLTLGQSHQLWPIYWKHGRSCLARTSHFDYPICMMNSYEKSAISMILQRWWSFLGWRYQYTET